MYVFRNARALCGYCGVKVRRDGMGDHCRKIHRVKPFALKPGEQPIKPRYSNSDEYIKDPINVWPEPFKQYDGLI